LPQELIVADQPLELALLEIAAEHEDADTQHAQQHCNGGTGAADDDRGRRRETQRPRRDGDGKQDAPAGTGLRVLEQLSFPGCY